jgi:hypothetical protein
MQADWWYDQPNQDKSLMVEPLLDTDGLIASRNGNSPKVTVAAG